MAISTRDKRGRATSELRPEQLYPLVRTIAEEGKPGHPESISVREFDKARAATGHDDAPSAKAICQRLADRDGKAMGWRRVKEIAFDETASIEHVERRRRASAPARYLSERGVYFALRLIAKRLDVKTMTPGEYDDERQVALKEERKRDRPRPLLAQLLPTANQIEQLFLSGDDDDDDDQDVGAAWDRALEVAELEPRAQLRDQRRRRGRLEESLPLIEAIHIFAELNGRLPSKTDLNEFGEKADVQLEAIRKPYRDVLREAIAYRQALGHNGPTELPRPEGGAGGNAPRAPIAAPAPGSIPGVARRLSKGRTRYARDELIAAIQAYLEDLDGGRPTQKGYGRYAVKNRLPATKNFAKHGGWKALLVEARITV